MVFTDAADSNSRQIQDVHTLLDSGIDLLIISPNDSEALSPVITEAYRRIPVILLDRSVIGFDYTLFIGPDNRLIGKQAGQYVTELLGEKGGKIVEILGRSGSPPVLDRSLGFREAIASTAQHHHRRHDRGRLAAGQVGGRADRVAGEERARRRRSLPRTTRWPKGRIGPP